MAVAPYASERAIRDGIKDKSVYWYYYDNEQERDRINQLAENIKRPNVNKVFAKIREVANASLPIVRLLLVGLIQHNSALWEEVEATKGIANKRSTLKRLYSAASLLDKLYLLDAVLIFSPGLTKTFDKWIIGNDVIDVRNIIDVAREATSEASTTVKRGKKSTKKSTTTTARSKAATIKRAARSKAATVVKRKASTKTTTVKRGKKSTKKSATTTARSKAATVKRHKKSSKPVKAKKSSKSAKTTKKSKTTTVRSKTAVVSVFDQSWNTYTSTPPNPRSDWSVLPWKLELGTRSGNTGPRPTIKVKQGWKPTHGYGGAKTRTARVHIDRSKWKICAVYFNKSRTTTLNRKMKPRFVPKKYAVEALLLPTSPQAVRNSGIYHTMNPKLARSLDLSTPYIQIQSTSKGGLITKFLSNHDGMTHEKIADIKTQETKSFSTAAKSWQDVKYERSLLANFHTFLTQYFEPGCPFPTEDSDDFMQWSEDTITTTKIKATRKKRLKIQDYGEVTVFPPTQLDGNEAEPWYYRNLNTFDRHQEYKEYLEDVIYNLQYGASIAIIPSEWKLCYIKVEINGKRETTSMKNTPILYQLKAVLLSTNAGKYINQFRLNPSGREYGAPLLKLTGSSKGGNVLFDRVSEYGITRAGVIQQKRESDNIGYTYLSNPEHKYKREGPLNAYEKALAANFRAFVEQFFDPRCPFPESAENVEEWKPWNAPGQTAGIRASTRALMLLAKIET